MPVQDFLNRYAFSVGLNKLSNFKLVSATGNSAANGTVDWYTPPAGKRAIFIGGNVASTSGTPTFISKFKSSGGSYYNIRISQTASTSGGAIITAYIGLDTNEYYSTTQSAATINMQLSFLEYDSDIPLKSVKVTSFSSGNNTIYTCPAGKTAIILGGTFVPFNFFYAINKGIIYWNNSSVSRTVAMNLVPSGGSPSSSNIILASAAISNGAFAQGPGGFIMAAGDFINITTDANTATQFAFVNILEL